MVILSYLRKGVKEVVVYSNASFGTNYLQTKMLMPRFLLVTVMLGMLGTTTRCFVFLRNNNLAKSLLK